jgi:integrase
MFTYSIDSAGLDAKLNAIGKALEKPCSLQRGTTMEGIQVRVFKRTGDPFYMAEWPDPVSGRPKRKSTKKKLRRDAERVAKEWEDEINVGQFQAKWTTWADFRKDYEAAHATKWAKSTKVRVRGVLDAVARILSPKFVRSIDADSVVRFVREKSKDGLGPSGIAAVLRMLKAALRWAARKKMIPSCPDIDMPENCVRAGGRALVGEEFDRMLAAIPRALEELQGKPASQAAVESWRHFLRLLWHSGLRIGESVKLHWTDGRDITPDIDGEFPWFEIAAQANKNRKNQRFPMAPECERFLQQTPAADREGFVSNPSIRGHRATYFDATRMVAKCGRIAGIVVDRTETDEKTETLYASAHDLRRSAATRWASKVMPANLQKLMRHGNIATTMKFYAHSANDETAAAIRDAFKNSSSADSSADLPKTRNSATTWRLHSLNASRYEATPSTIRASIPAL